MSVGLRGKNYDMKYIYALLLIFFPLNAYAQSASIAMHGDAKYAQDFTHFEYVNPNAPKGGSFTEATIGTYDSLNGFITKGVAAANLGLLYQPLMSASADEAFSKYGEIAQNVTVAPDGKSASFVINPKAKWHDGVAITGDDVVWTFNTLMEKGAPFYKAYYADVTHVDGAGSSVTFHFKTADNKELPLIVAGMTVLPKHYWTVEGREFDKTTFDFPLGSGPYKISKIDAGRSITYERVNDWWAADLPVNRGRYNFDTITVQYYRDATVALEALFGGEYDIREEYIAKTWATGYDNDLVKSGQIVKQQIANQKPAGMQAFIMNNRRPVFQDKNVRRAVQLAFDFEWSNKQFAFDAYKRTDSYFENSELASVGIPQGRELEILNEFKDQLPDELFTVPFTNPKTDGSGKNRDQLRMAMKALDDAGYKLGADKIRVHEKTGQRLSFEIMHRQAEFERWVLPFIKNLKRIGVEANFRVIDTPQFVERMTNFDYDMTVGGAGQSLSPGNEQLEYWHSAKADTPGSRNHMGIKNPVVDALVEMVINAPDRAELVHRTRALDRVLLWGYHAIPQWHINTWRVAHWDKFGKPDMQAPYALDAMDTWWIK
jgi:microcin C transport system substrate-binding protein